VPWSRAMEPCEPRQVRKEAAVSGSFHVPRGRLGTAACRGRNRNIVAARGAAFLFGRSDHVLRCAVSPLAAGEFCRSRGAAPRSGPGRERGGLRRRSESGTTKVTGTWPSRHWRAQRAGSDVDPWATGPPSGPPGSPETQE